MEPFADVKTDPFGGVTVSLAAEAGLPAEAFEERLTHWLDVWEVDGKRGIWLDVPLQATPLLPPRSSSGSCTTTPGRRARC